MKVIVRCHNPVKEKEKGSDKILSKLPKHILPFVKEVYKDSDGYWIRLKDGYIFDSSDSHVEHTDTLKELLQFCKKDNISEE